jgi:predicted ATPase
MLKALAIANYRSIRELVLPLGQLNLVTGPNGAGKSNLYRALRLLSETALGTATASIAAEGSLASVLWAGPEQFSRGMRAGTTPVQGGPRKHPVNLKLGLSGDDFNYAIDFGLPAPVPRTLFDGDPEIKRESIWNGDRYHSSRVMVDRSGPVVKGRDDQGGWQILNQHLAPFDSMLAQSADPYLAPEAYQLREQIRSWRFYDQFRTDRDAPSRQSQIGARTVILHHDGRDLPAAWRTIEEIGDEQALTDALTDAFPGAEVRVKREQGRFLLEFWQSGLLRPLSQWELSDGTLRYLCLIAALLTPRPPALMVLNEPEMSLHPDLLPALARLMLLAAKQTQLWVTSHSDLLIDLLSREAVCNHLHLTKALGETHWRGAAEAKVPLWRWPNR